MSDKPPSLLARLKGYDAFKRGADRDLADPPTILGERSTMITAFGKDAVLYGLIRQVGPETILELAELGREAMRQREGYKPVVEAQIAGLYNEVRPPRDHD